MRVTLAVCPRENGHGFCVATSQSRTVPSSPAEACTHHRGKMPRRRRPHRGRRVGMALLRGDAPESHGPGRTPGGDERSVGAEREARPSPLQVPVGPGQVHSCLPEATFQSVTPTSRAAVAIRVPSGLNATDEMMAESLGNIAVCWPVSGSQSRTVPSHAGRGDLPPSGRNATS